MDALFDAGWHHLLQMTEACRLSEESTKRCHAQLSLKELEEQGFLDKPIKVSSYLEPFLTIDW